MSNLNGVSLDPSKLPTPKYNKPQASTTWAFTSGVTQKGSIDFELLKPATIFKLIMGQPDVTLVTVTLPQFSFNFFYRQVFPIVGPLVATFGGGVGGNINLTFGYDTHGLQEFEADKNPADLIDGFFIDTLNPATGQAQSQITLDAQIAVGAELDLGFASAGVEGGIAATINFALDDLNNDTKVRLNEIAANLEANNHDPLANFDISGEMYFFLRAFITIDLGFFSFTQTFEFANLKLFSFNIPFTRPALLASQSGDTLTLNIGANAGSRLHGDLSDSNETIHVANDGGKVYTWSDQYGVDQMVGKNFEFSGIKHIVATGGSGNEFIDLSGVTDSSISASIQVGDGNHTVIGGNNTLIGGAGTDELFGGGLPTTFPSGFSAPDLH